MPQTSQVVLFGHDPVVVSERCQTLTSGGYRCVVTITAKEAEDYVTSGMADILLIGSQTGPLTRLRLADTARRHGVAVVHIAYPNHPDPIGEEIYVTRPLGPNQLLNAVGRALRQRSSAAQRRSSGQFRK